MVYYKYISSSGFITACFRTREFIIFNLLAYITALNVGWHPINRLPIWPLGQPDNHLAANPNDFTALDIKPMRILRTAVDLSQAGTRRYQFTPR